MTGPEPPARRSRAGRVLPGVPPGVLPGLLGTVVLGMAALSVRGRYFRPRLDAYAPARTLARLYSDAMLPAVLLLGCSLLLFGWVRVRTARLGLTGLRVTLLVWSLPLLAVPPLLSLDPVFYADQGWQVLHGLNPYRVGMASAGSPYGIAESRWAGSTTVYPPLALLLQAAVVAATGEHWYWGPVGMRLLAVGSVAAMAWLLPAVARRWGTDPRRALWFGLLNPVVLVHGVGGAHNDTLMAGLVVAAVWLAPRRYGLLKGSVAAGLAAGVKQPGLLAVLAVAAASAGCGRVPRVTRPGPPRGTGLDWPGYLLRLVPATGVAVLTVLAVGWLSGLGQGWISATARPDLVLTTSPADLVYLLTDWVGAAAGHPPPGGLRETLALAGQLVALAGGVVLWLRWGPRRPLALLVSGLLICAAGLGAFRIWYLIWALPLVAVAAPRSVRLRSLRYRLLVAVMIGCTAQVALLAYLPVTVLASTGMGAAAGVAVLAAWPPRAAVRPPAA